MDGNPTYQELTDSLGDLLVLRGFSVENWGMRPGNLSAFLLALALGAQSPPVKNPGWKTYKNANYNFSLTYPTRWSSYEGVDRNGVLLTPHDIRQFHLRPEIGVGGSVGQPSDADEARSRTIEEDFQFGLASLKEYGHARNLVVVSKVTTKMQGLLAVESTIRYEDGSNGTNWFDKQILIHSDDSTTYHLGLHCSPDDASVLLPLFDRICRSFRILGPRA
jgi:hypothetical protein